ncbi:uncharacterized protein BDZ83DRAFT_606787 [Colletotrichum acutatum]|uniref:Uncharacterized protein n=1 Tax=Glomerella acutata TaxID=27357 RepID=A0AAD8XKK8_GLOAC|nr:uncharacterized protein BDZ83DRAFT_606787 [Colletotrichum acutatum]KAK1729107.1 hypothetical protein BDZ83DRAFT_606787 [Colletotrichum acutatum]
MGIQPWRNRHAGNYLSIYLFLFCIQHATLFSRSPSVPPIPSVSRGTVWSVSVKVPIRTSRTHGSCGPSSRSPPGWGWSGEETPLA